MKKNRTVILVTILGLIFVATLFNWQEWFLNNKRKHVTHEEQELLEKIAEDTYRFFEEFTDPDTGLPLDRVDFENGVTMAEHTSPTNIAMYLASTIAAAEMDIITHEEAKEKIDITLATLQKMEKWNGLYYNWYYTEDGSLKTDWGQFISTVDNGWLTIALVATGQFYPEKANIIEELVNNADYSKLYDPNVGLMWGGYDVAEGKYTAHHYGMLYSETRGASYVAIGKGDVPETHWWKMYRTMSPEDSNQSQQPQGQWVNIDGVDVYEGHYEYNGIRYVPSWGGSMFEALMPQLFIKEKELGENALGLNNQRHVEGQIKYAKEKEYEAWGFSPAAIKNGYQEFGVKVLGASGYEDHATVTPHASILALEYDPATVIDNIQVLMDLGVYGDFGFYDTIHLPTKEVAKTYLALDQGMIMISITNFLQDGVIRDYFHNDPIGKGPEHLLERETFSIVDQK